MKGALLSLLSLIVASTFGDWIYSLWHSPLHLSCQGQLTRDYEGRQGTEPRTLHVEIDFSKEQMTAEDFISVFKISSVGTVYLRFVGADSRADYSGLGRVDRYTGSITVHESLGKGGTTFTGLCHQAERLF